MTQHHDSRAGFCRRTRREFFWEAGASFTGLALAGLLDQGFLARQSRAAQRARAELDAVEALALREGRPDEAHAAARAVLSLSAWQPRAAAATRWRRVRCSGEVA